MTGIAKAWVNYDSVNQVINASFNVSSVTYHSTGNFTVNFTTAMPNANYAVVTGAVATGQGGPVVVVDAIAAAPTTTACRLGCGDVAALKNQTRNYAAFLSS
jgi:hypothetical protein